MCRLLIDASSNLAENEFLGKKIDVKQAKNSQRPVIIPSGGGGSNHQQHQGNTMNPSQAMAIAAVAAAASGNTMSSLMQNSPAAAASMAAFGNGDRMDMYGGGSGGNGQFGPRGDGPMRQGGARPPMGMNGPPMRGGPGGGRAPEWICPQCSNNNFGFRDQCKQCGVSICMCLSKACHVMLHFCLF